MTRRWLLRACGLLLVLLATQSDAAKPRLRGLVYMGDIGFHRSDDGVPDNALDPVLATEPGTFAGVVVNLSWRQLEPTEGQLDTTALDAALTRIRAYNDEHPATPLRATVRVWPGPNAPDWAKRLDGPPVHVNLVVATTLRLTVGRVWAPGYRTAWRRLQDRLATRYDADPLVAETSAVSCSTITAESILVPSDAESVAALHEAGFTDAAFRTCLMESPADYAAWRNTSIGVFVNPYRTLDSGPPRLDYAVDEDYMRAWRKAFGSRAILANAGLKANNPPFLAKLYASIAHMGGPIAFQMYSPESSYYPGAVALGSDLGASEIELWGRVGRRWPGFTAFGPSDFREWRSQLRTQTGEDAPH